MTTPKTSLLDGSHSLETVLVPQGFTFQFRGEGQSSGGHFAWGEFVRADRRLEIHFRYSLGLVRYHIAQQSASHESYMRELGVSEQCCYPGFSNDSSEAFVGLAHDLAFAEDFLAGTGAVLRRASIKEASDEAARNASLMAGYVGDKREIEKLHDSFRKKDYIGVISAHDALKYPERLAESERKMVEFARKQFLGTPQK